MARTRPMNSYRERLTALLGEPAWSGKTDSKAWARQVVQRYRMGDETRLHVIRQAFDALGMQEEIVIVPRRMGPIPDAIESAAHDVEVEF